MIPQYTRSGGSKSGSGGRPSVQGLGLLVDTSSFSPSASVLFYSPTPTTPDFLPYEGVIGEKEEGEKEGGDGGKEDAGNNNATITALPPPPPHRKNTASSSNSFSSSSSLLLSQNNNRKFFTAQQNENKNENKNKNKNKNILLPSTSSPPAGNNNNNNKSYNHDTLNNHNHLSGTTNKRLSTADFPYYDAYRRSNTNNGHSNQGVSRTTSTASHRHRRLSSDLPSPIATTTPSEPPPFFVVSPVKATHNRRDSWLSAVSRDVSDAEPPRPVRKVSGNRPPPPGSNVSEFPPPRTQAPPILAASTSADNIGVAITSHQRGRHQVVSKPPSPLSNAPRSKKGFVLGVKNSIHNPSNPRNLSTPPQFTRIFSAPSQLKPPLHPSLSLSSDVNKSNEPTPPPSRAGHKRANSASFTNRSVRREPPVAPEPSVDPSGDASQTKSLPSRIKDKKILPLPKRTRLPARFSSNGVATSDTPPPSLIYRQSIPAETRGDQDQDKSDENKKSSSTSESKKQKEDLVSPLPSDRSNNNSRNSTRQDDTTPKNKYSDNRSPQVLLSADSRSKYRTPTRSPYNSLRNPSRKPPNMSNGRDLRISSDEKYGVHLLEDDDDDPTIRARDRISPRPPSHKDTVNAKRERPDSSTPTNNDDVFLNLARSNTVTTNSTNDVSARRRARLSQGQHRNSINTDHPRISYTTPPSNRVAPDPYTPSDTSPLSNSVHYQSTFIDEPEEHSLAHRSSFIRRSLRDKDSQLAQNSTHSRSFSEAPRTPLTRYSNHVSQRTIGSLLEHDRAAAATTTNGFAHSRVQDDTESTVSTTAPSMIMWDELDELKSRIRRLEMTGGRTPSSPNAPQGSVSNSSSDRPRTGTTAATTVSSSPHHNNHNQSNSNGLAPSSPTMTNIPSSQAPTVLQTALLKSKSVLPAEIFNALEAASAEALSLAQMAGGPGNPSPAALITDRQVRRKIESMCRSLTDLCISLSDGRMPLTQEEEEIPLRIGYPTNGGLERSVEFRSPSAIGSRIDRDVAATPSNSKVFPRFESRRGSILSNVSNSPAHRMEASPSPAPSQHRLSQRNSTILRHRSSTIAVEDEDPDQTMTASYRMMSRSQTESMLSGESPRQSEFGALPIQTPTPRMSNYSDRIHRAPSVAASDASRSSNLSHRRHFSSNVTNNAATSSAQNAAAGSRRFLERSSLHGDGPLIGTAISTNNGPSMSATARAIAIDQMRRREASAEVQMPGDEVYGTSVPSDHSPRLRNGNGSIGRVGNVSRRAMLGAHTYRDNGVGLGLGREREHLAQRNAAR